MNSHGVTKYAEATVELFFPNGDVCCAMCPLMDSDILKRKYCKRTGEYIADDRGRGYWCPLKIKEDEHE